MNQDMVLLDGFGCTVGEKEMFMLYVRLLSEGVLCAV